MAEPFIGEVDLYGFNFAPEHWAQCNGSLLTIADFQALFSLLSTNYGGDGRTSFGLPDLRGTLPVAFGTDPRTGLDFTIGQRKGKETHALAEDEMPEHSHTPVLTATMTDPTSTLYATTDKGVSETVTNGAYLSQSDTQQGAAPYDKPELFYIDSPDPTSLVSLGGVASGSLPINASGVVNNTGAGAAFDLLQTSQVLNYSMALLGLYPSRN